MCHFAFGMNLLRPSVRFSRSVPETGPAENHPTRISASASTAWKRTFPGTATGRKFAFAGGAGRALGGQAIAHLISYPRGSWLLSVVGTMAAT